MRRQAFSAAAALVLGLGSAACVDLNVANPNDPDRDQAFQDASVGESLIAGAFSQWFRASNVPDQTPRSGPRQRGVPALRNGRQLRPASVRQPPPRAAPE
jgi:hypothetical protein